MIVLSDTSRIVALQRSGLLHLLPALYGNAVLIPEAVRHELEEDGRMRVEQTDDGATSQTAEARQARARRLGALTYDEVLDQFVVYGTREAVADRLLAVRESVGFSTLGAWMNTGGRLPHERVLRSMRRFAERVIPRLA